MEQFLISEIQSVFVTDSKLSSHPIVQPVKNPDEITAIFDEISYQKVCVFILYLIIPMRDGFLLNFY